ncbi:NADH-quinone oxidoreductase subunit NuoE [Plebeiibacterium sediminum]|uniref:NADH-quinone oxidoreductase subunit NuoE n=1 Tax=Plebeiibacterium sediminum TaxID=2992112 RepID=A0AAE3SEA3_9BACT|nr:NADH-quinone oxidoreductase subunit NuoE [Plebeiobacterium sediminum]MCW3786195.1 NADH-quinone oxidoreductase subunit NuoE [Plebeiobacterium sediminum]
MSEITNLVKSLADKHGRYQESLLPILQGVVEQHKYLSEEAMVEIARELDISAARVFGTASFYSFLNTRPMGKYIIRVCKTITCMMHGKNQIIQELEKSLKIKLGETTLDGKFTLLETNCLGQCHKGPAMLINDEPYTELNPEKVREIIQSIKLNDTSKTSNPDLN